MQNAARARYDVTTMPAASISVKVGAPQKHYSHCPTSSFSPGGVYNSHTPTVENHAENVERRVDDCRSPELGASVRSRMPRISTGLTRLGFCHSDRRTVGSRNSASASATLSHPAVKA
jgi:hypothetical protein